MYRIAILGAGALGAMYAHRMSRTAVDIALVAEGDRGARLADGGVVVNGVRLHPEVLTPSECGARNPDLLIVALKHHQLNSALGAIVAASGKDTVVVSVMNGIESERSIASALRSRDRGDVAERVLMCMVAGMDAVRSGHDSVRYASIGKVFLGRAANDPEDLEPVVRRARDILVAADIPVVVPADAQHAVWNKWMFNCAINQWSAVLRAPYGLFQSSDHARTLLVRTMDEVRSVAAREGVELSEADREGWFPVLATLAPDGQTSMLQDVLAGRKTEVEMFAGAVCGLARRHGLPTPLNDTLNIALIALEDSFR